jgi:hypothetical protein
MDMVNLSYYSTKKLENDAHILTNMVVGEVEAKAFYRNKLEIGNVLCTNQATREIRGSAVLTNTVSVNIVLRICCHSLSDDRLFELTYANAQGKSWTFFSPSNKTKDN